MHAPEQVPGMPPKGGIANVKAAQVRGRRGGGHGGEMGVRGGKRGWRDVGQGRAWEAGAWAHTGRGHCEYQGCSGDGIKGEGQGGAVERGGACRNASEGAQGAEERGLPTGTQHQAGCLFLYSPLRDLRFAWLDAPSVPATHTRSLLQRWRRSRGRCSSRSPRCGRCASRWVSVCSCQVSVCSCWV